MDVLWMFMDASDSGCFWMFMDVYGRYNYSSLGLESMGMTQDPNMGRKVSIIFQAIFSGEILGNIALLTTKDLR